MSPAPDADHTVRFYDSDAHLLDQLTSFVREGLTRNERVVAMATTKHLDALRQIIAAQTLPADALQTIDAVEALDAIVVNDRLDEAEVARWFDARAAAGPRGCRVYEPLSVLGARGELEVALRRDCTMTLWPSLHRWRRT